MLFLNFAYVRMQAAVDSTPPRCGLPPLDHGGFLEFGMRDGWRWADAETKDRNGIVCFRAGSYSSERDLDDDMVR